MKKAFFLVLLLLTTLLPAGCSEAAENGKAAAELEFSPLLRIAVEDGAAKDTRLFYLPQSVGLLYVHPDGDGFSAGFVSPHRSISAERVLRGEGDIASVSVREEAKDRVFVLTEKGVYTLFLDAATPDSAFTPYPEKAAAEDHLFFDELTVLADAEELLLLLPVNMSETYVLAQKALLPDFASVLTVSDNGKKIWYTRAADGAYTGIGFFEYGKNTPLGNENFSFDEALPLADGKVLFTRGLEDGGTLYLYRDLDGGTAASVTVDTRYDSVTATPDGKLLAAVKCSDTHGTVDLFRLESGEKIGSLEISFGVPAPALALSEDGGKLFLAVGSSEEMILGTVET